MIKNQMESGLSMLSRIRGSITLPNFEFLNNETDKVYIIESDSNGLLASRIFTYNLIACTLNDSNNIDLNIHFKPNFYRILIFDGRCWFKEDDFIANFIAESEKLQQIKIYRATDDSILMMHLYDQLKTNFAINLNLQLVVIITNSSILFPELVDQLNQYLFSLSITVRVILIVDHLKKSQIEFYRQKPICDIIQCKLVQQGNEHCNKIITLQVVGKKNSIVEKSFQFK